MTIIEKLLDEPNQQRVLLAQLKASSKPVIIYGAGVYAYVLKRFLELNDIKIQAAMVDEEYLAQQAFADLSVVSTEDYTAQLGNCHIIVGITNYPPMLEKLRRLGASDVHVIDIPDYLNMSHAFMDRPFVIQNSGNFDQAYSLFDDELSRQTYIAAINTKVSENLTHIAPCVRLDNLYFPSTEFSPGDHESFLDVGGFTGDTIKEFHHVKHGAYDKIISLEPGDKNFLELQQTIADQHIPRVTAIKVGAWHEKTVLRFTTKAMHIDNEISETGASEIQVDTIDAILQQLGSAVSLIKLDINGAEYNALSGARLSINKYRPNIVVRLHKKEDFYRLPILLKEIAPDMKLYLRQRNYMSMMLILYGIFDLHQ
ncbi:FkbM family methyltransferase [Undibacterium umbellatum]|uniref:FkbM family methyltransferase n=1 Tax=Undibacterium umbellatum TaxID=2762300 RepID=A0ABR6ZBV0_9BURK|nr:FkbM family methyltransferase [Undibacterium umbellatum]MBC3909158.1 FkbM family methyltransferase [Undibacterium umbellatum]